MDDAEILIRWDKNNLRTLYPGTKPLNWILNFLHECYINTVTAVDSDCLNISFSSFKYFIPLSKATSVPGPNEGPWGPIPMDPIWPAYTIPRMSGEYETCSFFSHWHKVQDEEDQTSVGWRWTPMGDSRPHGRIRYATSPDGGPPT